MEVVCVCVCLGEGGGGEKVGDGRKSRTKQARRRSVLDVTSRKGRSRKGGKKRAKEKTDFCSGSSLGIARVDSSRGRVENSQHAHKETARASQYVSGLTRGCGKIKGDANERLKSTVGKGK